VRTLRLLLLSGGSGVAWALLARALVRGTAGPGIFGAVLASPAIGVLVGLSLQGFRSRSLPVRVLMAVFGLYLGAALFGLALGIDDLLVGPNSGPGWRRDPAGVLLQAVLGMLWGVTFSGWVLLLAPLSYLNLWLVEPRDGIAL
jgi:hypothetical protein